MIEHDPNRICKNLKCPYGVNGQPKCYYACADCDRTFNWRSVACCPECYIAYTKDQLDQRMSVLLSEKSEQK